MTDFTKNLNVKWRLAGFVAFMLLLIIGAGLGGLHGMQTANRSLDSVYNYQVLPLNELRNLESLFQDVVTSVDKTLFEEISPEQAIRNIEKISIEIDDKWKELKKVDATTFSYPMRKENNWRTQAKPLMNKTEKIITDIIALLEDRNNEKLDSLTDERLYPISEEYKMVVNNLAQESLIAVKNEFDKDRKRYEDSKKAFIATLIIGLFISLLASTLLIKGINEPLSRIAQAMDYMMQGDLTKRLRHDRHDEFGVLIDGFNQMADYLGELVSQIQQSGIQVTSSITELAATNKEHETIASEHAATTSEMAASSTQIAATGTNLMATTTKVKSLSQNTAFAASEGHTGLKRINDKMMMMDESTGTIVNTLSVLSEKANNIAGVVMTISKIADQTNLLSLNAAIEAEKAGEYGAGFSVVASEIRRLADQTAIATYDIEQMVQEVQSAISASVMGIDKFAEEAQKSAEEIRNIAEELEGVIEQVEVLSPQVESLTEGIEAQTLGAKQISEAVSQLNEAAQQTAESIIQTSTSISHLHRAALILQEGVERFKVDSEESDHATSYI